MLKGTEMVKPVQVKAKPTSVPPATSALEVPATAVHLDNGKVELFRQKSGDHANGKTDLEDFTVDTMTAPHHQRTLSDLKDFAEKSWNNENLEFMQAVQAIERQLSEDSEAQKTTIEAIQISSQYQRYFKNIYDRFIPASATKSINISKPARSKLNEENQQYITGSSAGFTQVSFRAAYTEIKNLAETGFIKEFKEKAKSLRDLQNEREQSHHSRTESRHASTNPGSLLYMHGAARYRNTTAPLTPQSKGKSHLQKNKQVIIILQRALRSYLTSISSYQNDDAGCGCCLCFGCCLDKPAIYKNINGLMVTLEHAMQHWQEAKVANLKRAISETQKRHLTLVSKQEQTIIVPINTALTALTIKNAAVDKFVVAGSAVHSAQIK